MTQEQDGTAPLPPGGDAEPPPSLDSDDRDDQDWARLRGEQRDGAQLGGATLARAEWSKVSLQQADLTGADLRGAQLGHVNLSDADLSDADLRGATLNNVNLAGVTLTGADLCGAVLKGVKLSKADARRTRWTGAALETVEFDGVDLSEARFDGTEVEGSTFRDTTLARARMDGLRASQCVLDDCRLHECDLEGATFETLLVKKAHIRGGQLGGALFRGAKCREFEVELADLDGAVFHQCSGLALLEEELLAAGARVTHSPTVQAWRALQANRQLQVVVAAASAVVLVGALLFVMVPSLWPSWLLLSRMEANRGNDTDLAWCVRYTELGEVLAKRELGDVSRQVVVLGTMAHCYNQDKAYGDAERIYQRRVELAGGVVEDRMTAQLELGQFYGQQERLEEAEEITRLVFDDPRASIPNKLDALRLREDIYQQRELAGADSEEWRELQVLSAETILSSQDENSNLLGNTPAELYFLGEIDLADRLLALTRPPVDHERAWQLVAEALERLVAADQLADALSLADHLLTTERFTHAYPRSLLTYRKATMLLDHDRGEEVEAFVEEVDEDADGPLAIARALVVARLALAQERPEHALQALVGLAETQEEVPVLLAEERVWAQVDAHLALEQEELAVETLFPMLQAVGDQETAQRVMGGVEDVARKLNRPDLMTAMLQRVDNPVFADTESRQDVILAALEQKARVGQLQADDPQVLELLKSPESWTAIRALQLVLDSGRVSGEEQAAIDILWTYARRSSGNMKADLGMMIVNWEMDHGNPGGAAGAVQELDLWACAAEHQRAQLYELSLRASLAGGDVAAAQQWLAKAQAEDPPLEPDTLASMSMQIVSAMQQQGLWAEALQLGRDGLERAAAPENRAGFRREVVLCLYQLGQDPAAEAELANHARDESACAAEFLKAEALERAGRAAAEHAALRAQCARGGVDVHIMIQAARFLTERDDHEGALAIVQQARSVATREEDRISLVILEARCAAHQGEPDAARERLDETYASLEDGEQRLRLTYALLDVHLADEDPDGMVTTYRRYVTDFPLTEHQYLWEQSARSLLRTGHGDRLGELGGKPEWEERIDDALTETQIRDAIAAGDFAGGWKALDEMVDAASDESERQMLAWLAQDLFNASSDVDSFVALLQTLRAGARPGGDLAFQVSMALGEIQIAAGQRADAIETLRPLLGADVSIESRRGAMQSYVRVVSQELPVAEVTAELNGLRRHGFDLAALQEARLIAVEGMLSRQQFADARTLLEPLAGQPLAESVAEQRYNIILRAWVEDGLYDEVLDLPRRFPAGPGMTACQVDMILLQSLPWGTEQSTTVRERIVGGCDLSQFPLDSVITLANTMVEGKPDEALAIVQDYRGKVALEPQQVARADIAEARLLARTGERRAAAAALRELIADSDDSWVVADAAAALLGDVYAGDETTSSGTAEADARRALARVPSRGHEARQIHRAVVGFYNSRQRVGDAAVWQRKLLELMSERNEERGYELLNLAQFELQTAGAGSSSWRRRVDEGLEIAAPGSTLAFELLRLDVAGDMARTSADRYPTMLDEALTQVIEAEKERFARALCDDLQYRMGDDQRGEALRQIVNDRWPPPPDPSAAE